MQEELKKKLKKQSKVYEKLSMEATKIQIKYDDEANEKKAEKIKKDLDKAEEKLARHIDNYAREVYEYLKKRKPELIRRKDRTIVMWDDAFLEFDELTDGEKASLVALAEGCGGKYKFKE